jgi:hypothetical protein
MEYTMVVVKNAKYVMGINNYFIEMYFNTSICQWNVINQTKLYWKREFSLFLMTFYSSVSMYPLQNNPHTLIQSFFQSWNTSNSILG